MDFVTEFTNAIAKDGLIVKGGAIADGKLHRCGVEGDRSNSKNGWYVLYPDEPYAGVYGCNKRQFTKKWSVKSDADCTPEEREIIKRRHEDNAREREKELRESQKKTAEQAKLIWDAAQSAKPDHPYAIAKDMAVDGLRIARWSKLGMDNCLLVPISDDTGEIVNLQALLPEKPEWLGRNKDFLAGGRKKGCWTWIGDPTQATTVVVCEGYATGDSINKATGHAVAVAFDAGNMLSVAANVGKKYKLIIAADNDETGLKAGRSAANFTQSRLVICPLEDKGSDFNDLAKKQGLDAVKKAFDGTKTPEKITLKKGTGLDLDAIDTYSPLIDVTAKGRPKATIRNLEEIMRRTGISARYNMMSKRPEITVPDCEYSGRDNALNDAFGIISDICSAFDYPLSVYKERLSNIANEQEYHPIKEWILSKPWDGINRTELLFETITLADEAKRELSDMLFHRWLTSAVAAVFQPRGIAAQGLLTFVGSQGLGKTSWFKGLVPQEFNAVKDGLPLDPRNKDDVMRALRFWIVELGELDGTFRKADIAALKAFITEDTDILRLPYAPQESTFARRTVFCGSVNNENYLQDPTGNRRFWTINVSSLNAFHGLDMQQVWAEVYQGYLAGDRWWLNTEEMAALNASNESYKAINPLHELIETKFNWQSPDRPDHMTATDIVKACGFDKPTKHDVNETAAYLKTKTEFRTRRGIRGFMMPPKMDLSFKPSF